MARFSKRKWPAEGPVLELLTYLDKLHRGAGQPSLSEMGKAVALAPSTLSAFFTGTRLVSRGNLELLVEHLGGDVGRAEALRRKAVPAWDGRHGAQPERVVTHQPARLEAAVFDAPVNRINRPEHLLGRGDLVHCLNSLLDNGERVLLYGLGGGGKTALAATVADQRVEAGKGRYLWLRPGGATAEETIESLVLQLGPARTLGLHELLAELGIAMCVIDDASRPGALHTLLKAIPLHIGVIVTSRRKFGMDHHFEVGGLPPADALWLLASHARNAPGIATSGDAALLCEDLGYHPYAIEIAGHHIRQYGMTAGELRAQIAAAPHELAMPGGFAPAGRESVRRLLDRSYATLDNPDAREVLRAMGAFFSAGATVELLAGYLRIGPGRVRAALGELVDLSIAKRAGRYYAIHDLTFSYARSLASQPSTHDSDVIRAARELVEVHGQDHELLAADLVNILGGAARARQVDIAVFLDIVETLATGGYQDFKGHTDGFLRLLDEAIGLLRAGGDPARLHSLLSKRGNAYYLRGEHRQAVATYREALAAAPTPRREAVLLSVIGKVLAVTGEHGESERHFARAYDAAESNQDEQAILYVLEQHSVAAFCRHDYGLVRDLTLKGADIAYRLGLHRFEAFFLNNLGTAEFELGICAAVERHQQAQAVAVQSGDDHLLALTHHALGVDRHAQEKQAEAGAHLREALQLYARLGETSQHRKLHDMMCQFGYLD